MDKKHCALVLGGAGFIGSQIAAFYLENGWDVTIVDALCPRTGGDTENIKEIRKDVCFINAQIDQITGLSGLISGADTVIDCMGWTLHRMALHDPLYDMHLNLEAHIVLIKAIPSDYKGQIVYLGSRGQYGSAEYNMITEETPMIPEDVQGIHKTAAESHLRLAARLNNTEIVSIRFPNCFGENQPYKGEDIGLIGGFIRDSLTGKAIEVFGDDRKRSILYVKDLVRVIFDLYSHRQTGFRAYNLAGNNVGIYELAKMICTLTGSGSVIKKELPHEVKTIDIGNAVFNDDLILRDLGDIQFTPLETALNNTINYYKGRLL